MTTSTIEQSFEEALSDVTRWHLDHGVHLQLVHAGHLAARVAGQRRMTDSGAWTVEPTEPEPAVPGEYFDVRDENGMTWRIFHDDGDLPDASLQGVNWDSFLDAEMQAGETAAVWDDTDTQIAADEVAEAAWQAHPADERASMALEHERFLAEFSVNGDDGLVFPAVPGADIKAAEVPA